MVLSDAVLHVAELAKSFGFSVETCFFRNSWRIPLHLELGEFRYKSNRVPILYFNLLGLGDTTINSPRTCVSPQKSELGGTHETRDSRTVRSQLPINVLHKLFRLSLGKL